MLTVMLTVVEQGKMNFWLFFFSIVACWRKCSIRTEFEQNRPVESGGS